MPDLKNVKFTAQLTEEVADMLTVTAYARDLGLDRVTVATWYFKWNQTALAERLVRAIEAGAVLTAKEILRDANGKTSLATTSAVNNVSANADLLRIGF